MLPQHLPRAHGGGGQSAYATTKHIVRLIHHLSRTQTGGIGFIWDNLVRSPLSPHYHPTITPHPLHNRPLNGLERSKIRVMGLPTHTRIAKLRLNFDVGESI
jgi:hypothetical protein